MNSIQFTCEGLPVAQPRAKACSIGGHARVYNPKTADAWKASVIFSAREASRNRVFQLPIRSGVSLDIHFFLPRPKGHYGSGKNVDRLKDSAPKNHISKPDLDNLEKAVMDAITRSGLWIDDSIVWRKTTSKSYGARPGAEVRIEWI